MDRLQLKRLQTKVAYFDKSIDQITEMLKLNSETLQLLDARADQLEARIAKLEAKPKPVRKKAAQ